MRQAGCVLLRAEAAAGRGWLAQGSSTAPAAHAAQQSLLLLLLLLLLLRPRRPRTALKGARAGATPAGVGAHVQLPTDISYISLLRWARPLYTPSTGPWKLRPHDGRLGLHTDVSPPRKKRRRPYARATSCAARAIPASCGLARPATRLCLGCCRAARGTSNTSTHAHSPVTDSATVVSAHARAPAPATLAICGRGAWWHAVQGGSGRCHRR